MSEVLALFLVHATVIIRDAAPWMAWNLFLAAIPLSLAALLFRRAPGKTPVYWVGVVLFVIFLPNAPYVLTDVIHLIGAIQSGRESQATIVLVLFPLYGLFFLAGLESYVLSLMMLGSFLRRQRLGAWVLAAELGLGLLSAFGIYLGRIHRFNSWDVVTQPDALALTVASELFDERPLVLVAIIFVVVTGLYLVLKALSVAVIAHLSARRERRAEGRSSLLEGAT